MEPARNSSTDRPTIVSSPGDVAPSSNSSAALRVLCTQCGALPLLSAAFTLDDDAYFVPVTEETASDPCYCRRCARDELEEKIVETSKSEYDVDESHRKHSRNPSR